MASVANPSNATYKRANPTVKDTQNRPEANKQTNYAAQPWAAAPAVVNTLGVAGSANKTTKTPAEVSRSVGIGDASVTRLSPGATALPSMTAEGASQLTKDSGQYNDFISSNLGQVSDWIEQSHAFDLESRVWSASEAAKQREWAERLSNTAHQREVADLIAAGLNPVLSAKLGGASVPNGLAATGDYNNTSGIISGLVGSATQAAIAEQQKELTLKNMDNQKELAYIQGYFGESVAGISANAMITSASLNYASSIYNSNSYLQSSLNQLEGVKYSADEATKRQKIQSAFDYYIKESLPQNLWSTAHYIGETSGRAIAGTASPEATLAQMIGAVDAALK